MDGDRAQDSPRAVSPTSDLTSEELDELRVHHLWPLLRNPVAAFLEQHDLTQLGHGGDHLIERRCDEWRNSVTKRC